MSIPPVRKHEPIHRLLQNHASSLDDRQCTASPLAWAQTLISLPIHKIVQHIVPRDHSSHTHDETFLSIVTCFLFESSFPFDTVLL